MRISALLLVLFGAAGWVRAEPAVTPVLTTVADIRALSDFSANNDRVLSLTGIVTLVDPSRKLLVLQDATGAVALYPGESEFSVEPGQRVSLEASACAPFIASLPGFPFNPSVRDIRDLFEAPGDEGNFHLTRMRGWLRPPVTGKYTFWVSSDDSSELSLSMDSNPAQAHRIAHVSSAGWTDRHDWERFPSQRSETFFLQAEESYFIEALQEQSTEHSHLAVAWEGPTIKRAVIDGKFVIPWRDDGEASEDSRGVLREYWTDFSVGNLARLKSIRAAEMGMSVRGLRITPLDKGVWPDPQPVEPGRQLESTDAYQWVEGEGSVNFMASDGTSATLELAVAGNRVLVRVVRWQGELPPQRPNLRVRFRGVRVGVRDSNDHLKTGLVSVPSGQQVTFFDGPGQRPEASSAALKEAVSTGPGGYFFTRGVVTFNDRVGDRECVFVQDARNGIFVSQAERRISPHLQVGQAVQIGGPLMPGRHAPGMNHASVNILGWQNLPVPAIPSAEEPAASYRDGKWTEIEGVARAVNDDGTVLLMGRRESILVWIGHTDRAGLESFVNSSLRLRGVMTLDLLGGPALLVPSRGFVEVMEPAPEIPVPPVPIIGLLESGSDNGWSHQVKVAGAVTYRNDRFFFLQDETGGVRVGLRNDPPSDIGMTVQVVGFPDSGTLNEATWQPLDAGAPVVPVGLDPLHPDPARDGMLVRIEGRLLAQRTRGADQVLELQSNQRIFEAVLENPADKLQVFANGSVLAVTGVSVLETASSSIALAHVLLRTPLDATLLQGPPWWTRQRTATAIGLLLAVLAASLIRIEYLKRRFLRQQASRLAFARGMLESQESERRRIAASLHDSLGQNLLVIRSQAHLALQAVGDQQGVRQRLEEISDTTGEAINEVREITHDLRPYQLDRVGLTQAIRAITRKISESHPVSFACHVDEIDGIFNNDSEIHVYRIIQEGINNIVKHSGATEATVVIKKAPGILSISIRDNGRGLTAGGVSTDAGFGLGGIRERAEIMGGTAKIDSSPGEGVNLQVQIPLHTPEK